MHRYTWRIVLIISVLMVITGITVFVIIKMSTPLEVSSDIPKKSSNSLIQFVTEIAGFSEEKTYLVLFQNNAELRPTGGFIGSFALVKLNRGRVVSVQTDDSYAVDRLISSEDRPPAPEPLRRWNATKAWYFRDANWDPDVPSSMATVLNFFYDETLDLPQYQGHTDGVIAITPAVIQRILGITGSITVEGKTFTPENFYQQLQLYVEQDYQQAGVPRDQRKAIIGLLGKELMQRFTRLSALMQLGPVLLDSLADRNIVLWFDDARMQSIVQERGWSGMVQQTSGDYLMFVDANLASLKTDPYVERAFQYHVVQTDHGLEARFDVDYNHTGTFSFLTTRLRSYARLYVPEGSKLIRVEGAMNADRSVAPGDITQTTEHGKTVFGVFVSIEPGTTHRLTFIYELPKNVLDQINAGTYTLIAQKQPGTAVYPITVDVLATRPIRSIEGTSNLERKVSENHVVLSGSMNGDESVKLFMK